MQAYVGIDGQHHDEFDLAHTAETFSFTCMWAKSPVPVHVGNNVGNRNVTWKRSEIKKSFSILENIPHYTYMLTGIAYTLVDAQFTTPLN